MVTALGGSRSISQTEIDALYKARAQKRVLDVISIDPTKISSVATPDDKVLQDYYAKNPMLFTAPEYRGMTIAVLSTDALTKTISVSDDQLKQEYDAKKDQLSAPEQRDIVQVVLQDEAKAKHLASEAKSSGDLIAAAKQNNENAVPLDQMEEKNLLPELAKPVFEVSANQVIDPVKTQLGWHVIQVKKIVPAGVPDFEHVKEKLRTDMQRDQAIELATKSVNQLDDELAAGHSLEDIADGLKLRLVKIAAIDNTGLTPAGQEPVEMPDRQIVIRDGFAQSTGETSPVEDDKVGNYYVVRTDEITPSAVKPFNQIKNMVAASWKSHEQVSKAQTEADDITQGLKDGKSPASFAANGITVRSSDPLSQLGDTDPLLPAALISKAFKLKQGETATAPSDRNQIVIRLAQIIDVDPASKDPRKNTISGQIKQSQSNDLFDEYMAHLYNVFSVRTDNVLLDRLRDQDN